MIEAAIEPVGCQLEKLKLVETPTSKGSRDLVPVAVKHVQAAFGGVLRVLLLFPAAVVMKCHQAAVLAEGLHLHGPKPGPELVLTRSPHSPCHMLCSFGFVHWHALWPLTVGCVLVLPYQCRAPCHQPVSPHSPNRWQ
jgi:hypothetical protein